MPDPILRCTNLAVGWNRKAILPPISLEIRPGEFWAVVGRNGCGKSTWFKTILGMIAPVSGEVAPAPGVRMGYVPQRSAFDEIYPMTGRQVVALGLERGWSFLRPHTAGQRAEISRAIEKVGAEAFADRPFRALSEGQKQRILLARLVTAQAQVAFLDEPTAAMDAVAEEEALIQVDRIRKEQDTAIVIVSHNLHVARHHADHVVYLDPLQVAAGTADEIFALPAFRKRYAASLDEHRSGWSPGADPGEVPPDNDHDHDHDHGHPHA